MLQDTRLFKCFPNVGSRNLNMTTRFARIVEQHPAPNNVGFPFGEVAPTPERNKGPAISSFGGNKKSKDYANKNGDQALD